LKAKCGSRKEYPSIRRLPAQDRENVVELFIDFKIINNATRAAVEISNPKDQIPRPNNQALKQNILYVEEEMNGNEVNYIGPIVYLIFGRKD